LDLGGASRISAAPARGLDAAMRAFSRRRGFASSGFRVGDRREAGAGRRGRGKARDVARAGFHALLSLCAID
jgi:hypothetical protein